MSKNILFPPGKPGVYISEEVVPDPPPVKMRPVAVVLGVDEPTLCLSMEDAVQVLGDEAHDHSTGIRWYFENGQAPHGLWLLPHPDRGLRR